MEFMNVVRMTIKAGKFDEWKTAAEQNVEAMGALEGLLDLRYIKTGENSVCVVGRWESEDAIKAARPKMIANLDKIRHLIDGDTDPVSGAVIMHRSKGTATPA